MPVAHGIYNVTLQVIVADAFIIGGGMLEHSVPWPVLVVLPHGSQSLLASEMCQNYTAL